MQVNRYGEVVRRAWFDLPRQYPNVELGEFIVMPKHVHGIIILNDNRKGGFVSSQTSETEIITKGIDPLPAETKARPDEIIKTSNYL